jgi:hypothetical protein
MDADETRIINILGGEEVPEVTEENLLKYRKYLLQHFDRKAILTGREDFPWEEKYVLGPFSRTEYEKLKKTHPSYTDEYELLDILEDEIEERDLLVKARRLSDGKVFDIGLSWLTTKKNKGNDHQMLDDFATWVVNW